LNMLSKRTNVTKRGKKGAPDKLLTAVVNWPEGR